MKNRILIVDDERDVLEALARAARIAGYSVEMATSATEALALCADHAFDLLVLDFIMPGMSGLELLNKIRALHPLVRSIIVSGKVDPDLGTDEVEARLKVELEADAYFSKPVSNELLLERIDQLLTLEHEQKWEKVADRILTATKPATQIKKTERALKGPKRRKTP